MIYIREYNNYNDINSICKEYGIKRYTISNGMVDVDGGVDLSNKNLDKLPLTFGIVTGVFYCDYNKLSSLEGAPNVVGGDFFCNNNQLTSLEGSPKEVGGDFHCFNNRLTSLEGAPIKARSFFCPNNQLTSLEGAPIEVGGDFFCYTNKLTSLEGSPREVGGNFYCYNNKLTSLEGGPKEVGVNFYCYNNKLTSLKGAPRKVGGFDCSDNNLPKLFTKYINGESYWKDILKWQEDYSIWRNDGSLDEYRFKELIKDIEGNDIH